MTIHQTASAVTRVRRMPDWPSPPCILRNMSVLMYANGFTHWHYRHDGNLADVLSNHFFADAADLIKQQDRVTICAADGNAEAVFWGEGRRMIAVPMVVLARPAGV